MQLTQDITRETWRRSWRAWYGRTWSPVGPAWMQWFWTLLFSAAVAVGFTILGFAAYGSGEGAWRNWSGWAYWYGKNLVVSSCIGFAIHGLFSLGFRLIGRARFEGLGGGLRNLFYMGVPLLGVAIGLPLGTALAGSNPALTIRLDDMNALVGTVLVAMLITSTLFLVFRSRARALEAEKRAAEAQLRLLQGQIEPHFLFNTLANVLSLIENDTPKAKRMLEAFTDYLRASLASLRHDASPLGHELDLAETYLRLLQSRMEDRLRFTVQADAAARQIGLPPLLLQPLVENAVMHGLEPQVEGGTVAVRARLEPAWLVVDVCDDGRGPGAPPRRASRKGSGLALANIRERLLSRYGSRATLELVALQPGTRATLRLPLED